MNYFDSTFDGTSEDFRVLINIARSFISILPPGVTTILVVNLNANNFDYFKEKCLCYFNLIDNHHVLPYFCEFVYYF
jgi:hypothetical protein